MIETVVQDRNSKLEEYLQLLRLMAFELNRAMQAMVQNSLPAFEESLANQQIFSERLGELAHELSHPAKDRSRTASSEAGSGLSDQVRAASDALHTLNRRYEALIQHSSRSVALMVSLFSSYQGQLQEESGPRLKQQTWSCQI